MEKRDPTLDTLRGIAILTMVCANSAASILAQRHPIGLRLYGTWAAPLFILLSGFLVAFTAERKQRKFDYYLLRGLLILVIIASFESINYGIYPFTTINALYLIAVACPLSYLFYKLKLFPQFSIIAIIFVLTPFLQNSLGYRNYPLEFPIPTDLKAKAISLLAVLKAKGAKATLTPIFLGALKSNEVRQTLASIGKSWLISGWFPLFPWLGFSFLGVCLARVRLNGTSFAKIGFLFLGLGILLMGIVIWWIQPGSLLVRQGHSEMFYPPTVGYVVTAIGLILLIFFFVDLNPKLSLFLPFQVLGECSLFLYLLHCVLIDRVLMPRVPKNLLPLGKFLGVYAVFSVVLFLVALGIKNLKTGWGKSPLFVRLVIGG